MSGESPIVSPSQSPEREFVFNPVAEDQEIQFTLTQGPTKDEPEIVTSEAGKDAFNDDDLDLSQSAIEILAGRCVEEDNEFNMTASIESSRPRPTAFDDTFNRSKTTDERASHVKSPYDDMSYSRS